MAKSCIANIGWGNTFLPFQRIYQMVVLLRTHRRRGYEVIYMAWKVFRCDWIDAAPLNWIEALILSGVLGILVSIWVRDRIKT